MEIDMINTKTRRSLQGGVSPLDRLAWVAAVARDRSLPSAATRIAALIALLLNSQTGTAWPSQRRLAAELDLGVETIRRSTVAMVAAGLLIAETGRGRGHSNIYRIATKIPSEKRGSEEEKALDIQAENPSDKKKKTPLKSAPNKGREQRKENRGDINLADARENMVSRSDNFLDKQPASKITVPGLLNTHGRADRCTGPENYDDADAAFDRFWRAFPRREARGAARKAWTTVLKCGADPDAIVSAASRYAAQRATAEPDVAKRARFTAMPAKWLADERWCDEAPAAPDGVLLDGLTGEPIVEPRSTPRGASDDLTEGLLRYAQMMEARDAA